MSTRNTRRKRKAEAKRKLEEKTDEILRVFARTKMVKAPPSNPELLRGHIHSGLHRKRPLHLVVFWGGSRQGRRKTAGGSEGHALRTLHQFRELIHKKGLETEVQLLLMDTYSRHVNKRPDSEIQAYEKSMRRVVRDSRYAGVSIGKTSDHVNFVPFPEKARTPSQYKWARRAEEIHRRIMKNPGVLETLQKLATSHGGSTHALSDYIRRHAYEDPMLARRFPRSVFLSFGHDQAQRAISNLPTGFLYYRKEAGKIGIRGVPWFRE
ncbi:hypothetical protein KJ765_03710 [Candidatus Micrarchaeota archaeon]|nr:hypothetical protein [Candidatus Micrarchaeota archaeon]